MSAVSPAVEVLTDCWNRIGVAGDAAVRNLSSTCIVIIAPYLPRPVSDCSTGRRHPAISMRPRSVSLRHPTPWFAMRQRAGLPHWRGMVGHSGTGSGRGPSACARAPRAHRGGLLAGLVNIRGELQLCVRFDQLLGITSGVNDVAVGAKEPKGISTSRPGKVARRGCS